MKILACVFTSAVLASGFSSIALATDAPTQGPDAKLYKLPDRWVSVLPKTVQEIAAEEAAAKAAAALKVADTEKKMEPEVQPAEVQLAPGAKALARAGYKPDLNYSGTCHVTVELNNLTYIINSSSSTDMVQTTQTNTVCLPTENLAIRYGFKKIAR